MRTSLRPTQELLFWQGLPASARLALGNMASQNYYEAGSILFAAGQGPRGVFLVRTGKIKVSTSSDKDEGVTLRIGWPGEILGLSATISGQPYEATAEAIGPSQADFVNRKDFLCFLDEHPEARLQVVQLLGHELAIVNERAGLFHRSRSATARLAILLLAWCAEAGTRTEEGICLTVPLTESDMGQMIGASRETVARVLGKLKDLSIIRRRRGEVLVVLDTAALEELAGKHASATSQHHHISA